MRTRGKVDQNQKAIVEALRKAGWETISLASVGGGCPDLVAWHRAKGLRLIEIKAGKGKLTIAQQLNMAMGWPIKLVRSVDDAINL